MTISLIGIGAHFSIYSVDKNKTRFFAMRSLIDSKL